MITQGSLSVPGWVPYSTTHIATQINIKFSSQNLFVVGIIQMAHKRPVMQRQQRAFHNRTTTLPPYCYPNYPDVMRLKSRHMCKDRYSYKDMLTHTLHFLTNEEYEKKKII
jgi:hypothetical protein